MEIRITAETIQELRNTDPPAWIALYEAIRASGINPEVLNKAFRLS